MQNSHTLQRSGSFMNVRFRLTAIALVSAAVIGVWGCGGGTSQSVNNQPPPPPPPPTPTIATISPNSAAAGGAAFTLTINGTNFVAASMVNFGGAAPATTFVNSTQLTAAIPAAAIASTGTMAVTVTNPATGGGTSNAINFTITSGGPNPVPTINFLGPSCALAGWSFAGGLTVQGQNFVASSVVRWNGSDQPTAVGSISGQILVAQVSASDIAAAGTAAVTVFNPPPGGGTSNSLTFTITTTGAGNPQSISVDPAGKFAYVADTEIGASCDVGYVSMYMINPTTGALASIGLPVSTQDSNAESVTVDPFGKFAYVANYGSVTIYTINPTTGALASIGPPVSTGDSDANSVTVDPFGKFAYVASMGNPDFSIGGDGSVTMYTINATTGALTYTGSILGNCPGLCVPLSVVVDPSGKFAYVPNGAGIVPNVAMYTINATTGALTSIGTVAVAVGGFANWAAVDPSGKFAYVTASPTGSADDVSMYTINATTGALTSIGTVAAGTGPVSVVVDPSGKFAYVANRASNDISMYTINATTGALTSIGTIAAGSIPTSIAIHPSGKFAYVTNSASNNISMYSIDTTTGVLTLIGTIGT